MTPTAPPPGYPTEKQRVAWFRQVLVAMAKGDAQLLAVARRELWRLGIEVAPAPEVHR